MKHDSSKTTLKSSLNFEVLFVYIQSSTYLYMYDSCNNNHKTLLVLVFPKCAVLFIAIKSTKIPILEMPRLEVFWDN